MLAERSQQPDAMVGCKIASCTNQRPEPTKIAPYSLAGAPTCHDRPDCPDSVQDIPEDGAALRNAILPVPSSLEVDFNSRTTTPGSLQMGSSGRILN